jgi:hypothetical protein
MATEAQRERALKLADRLIEAVSDWDEGVSLRAQQIRKRLKTPMKDILEKVPGGTVPEKCKKIGITRQAYYGWLKGGYRPDLKQSKRLASLTGFDVEDIFWKEV